MEVFTPVAPAADAAAAKLCRTELLWQDGVFNVLIFNVQQCIAFG
jgi:hypothetical protein